MKDVTGLKPHLLTQRGVNEPLVKGCWIAWCVKDDEIFNLKIAVDGSTNYACDSNAEARMDLIAAKY